MHWCRKIGSKQQKAASADRNWVGALEGMYACTYIHMCAQGTCTHAEKQLRTPRGAAQSRVMGEGMHTCTQARTHTTHTHTHHTTCNIHNRHALQAVHWFDFGSVCYAHMHTHTHTHTCVRAHKDWFKIGSYIVCSSTHTHTHTHA
jgi:hypothetical protein